MNYRALYHLYPNFFTLMKIILALLFLTLVAHGTPSELKKFIGYYCIDCHEDGNEKGSINLETFHETRSLELLFNVYDQAIFEYMPPQDKKLQPTSNERSEFVAALETLLAKEGHDPKTLPGNGNYVDHKSLFTPNDKKTTTERRAWRVDGSAMAEIANKLIGERIYREKRQGVDKESPAFAYRAPAHTFRDFASTSYIENTTGELLISYAKEIARHVEEKRFSPQVAAGKSPDRIGTIHRLLFEREISSEERSRLEKLDHQRAIAALILKSESLFRLEGEMSAYQLARTLGFSLNEAGPDPNLYLEIATRPLADILDERMQTDEFNLRLVRFMREYFEYDGAPDVFKAPEDQPPEVYARGPQYNPAWHVEDADHFCLRIIREDKDVLKQLLTSNNYSIRGGWNSNHIRVAKRGGQNGYRYGFHGVYGVSAEDLPPWRFDFEVPHRKGILHHPAWLISFSDNEHNQAIQRGRWVNTKLLGDYIPSAPVEVDASLPEDESLTLREKMSVTRAQKCWACHRRMDEMGLPFEQFDFLGHYRTTEKDRPVVVTGEFLGQAVESPYDYVEKLAQSKRVQQVFLRHVFRFFVGRNEKVSDANTLISMDEAYNKTGSLKAAIKTLFLSDSYRMRN